MSEVCDELFLLEKELLSETHDLLKHEIKTGILAQMRAFEYILKKVKNEEDIELIKLLELSYETSISQYFTVSRKIKELEKQTLTTIYA